MAIVHGESGAWKDARGALQRVGVYPEDTASVRDIVVGLEQAWDRSEAEAVDAFNETTRELELQIAEKRAAYDVERVRLQREYDARVAEFSGELEPLPEGVSLITRGRWWIRRGPLLLRRYLLERKLMQGINAAAGAAEFAREELEKHRANRDDYLASYRGRCKERLDVARRVLESPEYAGAVAEEDALEQLKLLPDSYHVFADVQLRYHKYLFYEREHLQTAQLDYVVVGPPGVFVVEVKRWSRAFVESGRFHDPYKQVDRGQYLCYKMLSELGLRPKVRSVIATRSQMPERPARCFAKVLAPSGLRGYIEYFPPQLDAEGVSRVVRFFAGR